MQVSEFRVLGFGFRVSGSKFQVSSLINRVWNLKFKSLNLFVFCFLFFGNFVHSQCAMCRASLESSGQTKQMEAVNDGIVYLMAIPYILVAVVGYAVFRMFRKKTS